MKEYNITQWLLLFYIFSFCGWIIESSFVSWQHKRLVNRGFLIGPWIPIYGFGGVIMLFCALPFYQNPFLVFIMGMVGASTLEYFTGMVMEKLFAIKYWDYTGNFMASKNGYICLATSLCWGGFTLILTYGGVHWIDGFIYKPKTGLLIGIDAVLTALFTADLSISVKAALHLKKLSELVDKANAEMGELIEKLPDDLKELHDAFTKAKADGRITRDEWNELIGRASVAAGDRISNRKEKISDRLTELKSGLAEIKSTAASRIDAKVAFDHPGIAELTDRFATALKNRQLSFDNDLDFFTRHLLNSNPSASSRLEGFKTLKDRALHGKKKDKK